MTYIPFWGLPGWLSGRESACDTRDTEDVGSILGSGRSPRGEHGNPLQYSCLENPMDKGAWRATIHRVAKSQMWLKRLSMHTCTHACLKYLTCASKRQTYGMGTNELCFRKQPFSLDLKITLLSWKKSHVFLMCPSLNF